MVKKKNGFLIKNVKNKHGIKVGIERKGNNLAAIEVEERKQWMSRNAFQEK